MDVEKQYQAALDYLYSFVDYSLTRAFRYAPEKFDLGRMRNFMAELGQPQASYPIIHVAGTKGKGMNIQSINKITTKQKGGYDGRESIGA